MAITLFGAASTPVDDVAATEAGPSVTITPPASMTAGDLAVVYVQYRGTHSTLANFLLPTTYGGQDWQYQVGSYGTNISFRQLWCRFNGTWSVDPIFSVTDEVGTPTGTAAMTAVMLVFRPTSSSKHWQVREHNIGTDSTNAITITGYTPGVDNTVTVAAWGRADDVTFSNLSGTNWTQSGLSVQYRNTTGTDQACSFAYQIQSTAAALNNVAQDESIAGLTRTIITTFCEMDLPSAGTAGTLAVVQSAEDSAELGGTTLTATFGSAVTSGNSVIGYMNWETANAGWPIITDNQSNTYYHAMRVSDDSVTQDGIVFWCTNITNAPTAVTVTISASEIFRAITVVEINGGIELDKVAGVWWLTSDTGSADTVSTYAVTPSSSGQFCFGGTFNSDAHPADADYWHAVAPWSNENEIALGGVGNEVANHATFYFIQAVAASLTFQIDNDLGRRAIPVMATFKAASSVATPALIQPWNAQRLPAPRSLAALQRYWQATPADPIPVDPTMKGGPGRNFFLVKLRRY